MTDDRARILSRRLEEAFGHLDVPAPETIVRDPDPDHLECRQVVELLGGKHWTDLGPAELMYEHAALNFLSPGGFRFYLPAFARFALLDFEAADMIPIVIVWSLGYSDDDNRRRIALFDAAQRAVLADCVRLFAELAPDDFTGGDVARAIRQLGQSTP